jgi:hypothetical protein
MLSLSLVYRPSVRAWNVPTVQYIAWARAYGRRIYHALIKSKYRYRLPVHVHDTVCRFQVG